MASSGRRASRMAIGAIALLAGMALPLGGCGEDDEALDPQQLRPRSGLEQIGSLPGGKDRLEERPATCRRTHAVLIAAGKPQPARLELRPGDCVVWGNKGAADVGVQSAGGPPRMSGKRAFGALFAFAMTIGAREVGGEILGPVTRLTPARRSSRRGPEARIFRIPTEPISGPSRSPTPSRRAAERARSSSSRKGEGRRSPEAGGQRTGLRRFAACGAASAPWSGARRGAGRRTRC